MQGICNPRSAAEILALHSEDDLIRISWFDCRQNDGPPRFHSEFNVNPDTAPPTESHLTMPRPARVARTSATS